MMVSIPMTFSSANSIEYLVSIVGGNVSLKGLILAKVHQKFCGYEDLIIYMILTREKGSGFSLSAKGMVFLYAKVEEKLLSYDAYEMHVIDTNDEYAGKILVPQVSNLPLWPLSCYQNGCPTNATRMANSLVVVALYNARSRIKGNVTSSKPATFHDAINMAYELFEQESAKALRIGDSNKRKWEDQQGNKHHQQQNQRQEVNKVYVAAPAKGRGYAGNLPWCNRCKAHHQPGPCPPRCGKCRKLGPSRRDCRTRIPVARDNSLQNVTCFGCGNQGHYRSDCPERRNQNHEN
ncbi:putative reverse transcriptase domain-containing protein [Tanacetum coccineum]